MQRRVAIIAYSLRFPGTDIHRFWHDLLAKKDFVTEVDPSRWEKAGFLHPDKRHPGSSYTFAAGSLGDISGFDAAFFGISPREAALIDPQQRMLLELAWEAFENAGIPAASLRGSDCGVYVGISTVDYAYRMADDLAAIKAAVATGNVSSIAANRISYVFDLHGPSIAMDTACSSSLVAFHQACQAIRCGEISQALAGGINLHLHPYGFISFSKATMLSKTGRCHVFDESGDGYVRSEGGGLFLLKEYEQALADCDPILAVVAGSAVNTDGHKSGLTIPSTAAQASLIARVYQQAKISPDAIDYFEAHGTGTAVGDPIETHAIGLAIGQKRRQPLLIGSIKSNIGHLESASGVAGLAKALNCLQHRAVPPTIGIKKLNPNIKFGPWHLKVATETQALKPEGELIIGVNSFGFGGANAHVILKSPSLADNHPISPTRYSATLPLFLSGKDSSALRQAARDMAEFLNESTNAGFYDTAYSAFYHRDRHQHVALVFSDNNQDAAEKLRHFAETDVQATASVHTGIALANAKGPVFVYSGNGCQWQGMGRQLLAESATFRQTLAAIDDLFSQYADFSLMDTLSGPDEGNRYQHTEIAQPALFALQVGMTEMLREQGIFPAAVLGHSVGEVAAAWAAGALTLAQAVQVIYFRSHHQGQTKGSGGMTAVGMDADGLSALLVAEGFEKLHVAGINSQRGCTVAGDLEHLANLETKLAVRATFFKRLPVDYAFHSPAMDSIEAGILADLSGLKPQKPSVPFFSSVTGQAITDAALTASYWWHNIRQPVRFQQAVDGLISHSFNVFVEISSHPILQAYINDGLKSVGQSGLVFSTLSKTHTGLEQLLHSGAKLLMSGVPFNHKRWFPIGGQFVRLPNYPWQRESLWHPVTCESQGVLAGKNIHPLLGHSLAQQDWTWENQLDTQLHPFLADHNVGGAVVFPGSGFAELALAAAHLLHGSGFLEIEELEIRSPLLLSHDQTKLIRFNLNPSNGQFTLNSREYGQSSEWHPHSLGRILSEATGHKLQSSAPKLPNRAPDFDTNSHAALTKTVDLSYGPAFMALGHGWVDGNEALASLVIPASIRDELAGYHLHPGLLDCAFQLVFQILKDFLHQQEDTAFVPVKIGRLNFRCGQTAPTFAKAKLLHKLPHSLKAEFTLYDSQGQAIALLQDVRFRAVRLQRTHSRNLSFLDYHLTPAPLDNPSYPLDTDRLARICDQATAAAERYSLEVEPLLDSLYLKNAADFLAKWDDGTGLIKAAQFYAFSHQHPQVGPALSALLAYARANHYLTEIDGQHWQINQDVLPADSSAFAIWRTLNQDYPDYAQIIQLAGRVSLHWHRLCSGDKPASELGLFPDVYGKISSQILKQTGKQKLLAAIKQHCQDWLQQLPYGSRVSILELGNYRPECAAWLCPFLDFRQSDYCFASFCEQALEAFKAVREQFPKANALKLSDWAEPLQPAQKSSFAIVHLNQGNREESQRLLALLPTLLHPGSPVLVIGLNPTDWLDGLLGFADAWWQSAPDRSAAVSPQIPSADIADQLGALGFKDINSQPLASSHYLLTANTAAAEYTDTLCLAESSPWLILADADGASAGLAKSLVAGLKKHQQAVTLAHSLEGLQNYPNIIHLRGFGENQADGQSLRCWLAAELAQALEQAPGGTQLWLVTQGVGSIWRNDQTNTRPSQPPSGMAHDAALWGFGRTLMNEVTGYQVHLLDINGDCQNHGIQTAVLKELLVGQGQETVLSANGQRFVPRLRVQSTPDRPALPAVVADDTQNFHLGFKLPGQLRNLHWQAVPNREPSDDEIEVAVHATGLNFRDVMYTLGLLSDEAVENGFVGASLGLEFAGIVTRVGTKAGAFKPGDCVVGLGPASFSNRVLSKANTLALIPGKLSPAAAATIPSTFFTVYYALHHQARLQTGETVLIHGAAGGVGLAAIQVARYLGAEIYATVGAEEKRDFLKLLGIEHIHDSRSLTFAEEILAKTGNRGVDVVLNSLAGEAINRNFHVLKPFGRFLELGKRDFYENTAIGLRPFRNNISYFGIDADQLMQERPQLTRQLFAEVMQLFQDGLLHPLPYTLFDANQVTDAFRFMQQAKQIGKVVVTYKHGIHQPPQRQAPDPKAHWAVSEHASYWVTGGLSGFGLRSAQWLVDKGAKHLVLLSRSGANNETAKAALRQWAEQGVKVIAVACDVTDKVALSAVFKQCAASGPALKGVIHAAAVIDDGLVRTMSQDQLQRVLKPKIAGALALHELTLDQPLDFFVLYSSVTTLFGNPGQANYVAGNLWLEALAAHRCQLGLPATCVRWGAIDDVGFLARNPKIKEALQNRLGGKALESGQALAVLENLLATGNNTLGVMDFDWRTMANFLPTARQDKFTELALQAGSADPAEDALPGLKRLLEELSDAELQSSVIDLLKEELSQILLISKDKIDPHCSMYDMGLDSLMGVELMMAIENRFNVQVPVLALSEAPTLSKLASRLIAQLRGGDAVQGNDLEANIVDLSKRHASDITDAETSALIAELQKS